MRKLLSLGLLALLFCNGGNPANNKSAAPQISSLSTANAEPLSALTIAGTGFGDPANTMVRFSDSGTYRVDVHVINSTSSSIAVCVPPYSMSNAFSDGLVGVQVLQVSNSDTIKSNSIGSFHIQNLPTSTNPAGYVTLALFTSELSYYDSLKAQVIGTAMETPTLDSAISSNVANLSVLVSQIQGVEQGTIQSFVLGGINGVTMTVDASALQQSDRLILALWNSLNNSNGPALAKMLRSQGYEQDVVSSVPSAFNTAFTLLLSIGGATAGAMELGLIAAGITVPPMAFALTGCMLMYAGVAYMSSELVIGAELHNIDNPTSYNAIQLGVKQAESLLHGAVNGFQETDLVEKVLDECDKVATIVDMFTPPKPGCVYQLSFTGQNFAAKEGSGTVSIIVAAGTGCSWEAGVDNVDWITLGTTSGTGTGAIGFTVLENTTAVQRSGSIFVNSKEFTITQDAAAPPDSTVPPANIPAGIYSVEITITPNGGSTVSYDTCTDANMATFTQSLTSSMNSLLAQWLSTCSGAGCSCTAMTPVYTPWNGGSYTMTGSVVGLSANSCLGGTETATYTVTKTN